MGIRSWLCLSLLVVAPLALAADSPTQLAPHRLFSVSVDKHFEHPVSGRLLLFAIPAKAAKALARGGEVSQVDTSPFHPEQTAVAATEITSLAPGSSVLVDADKLAFPKGFSRLDAGTYMVQAVLDTNHDYNYGGRGTGDLVSEVMQVEFGQGKAIPELALTVLRTDQPSPWTAPQSMPDKRRAKFQKSLDAAKPHARKIDFTSPALSRFWGRPIHMKAWVLLPPGYAENTDARYPTVFFTHGFGGTFPYLAFKAAGIWKEMSEGNLPPMIWVLLDESGPTGTHEFADSVNNGPWGTALTEEVIPQLESRFRMDAKPEGRFLTGHSSGGWATLWLQVRYPKMFGGTWSTAPDPSDFRNFTGVDMYADNANAYVKPDGSANPLVRAKGVVVATFQQFAQLERVLGPYGGQLASFDWVFSPRGPDGRPVPMFDRDTGEVNPKVAAYWREHYDIGYRIRTHWPQLKPDLNGKIHVIVGTADTFYLNESARLLQASLERVGADAEVLFVPGKTHGNLYARGGDRNWLQKQIAWDMYRAARPDAKIPDGYRAGLSAALHSTESPTP